MAGSFVISLDFELLWGVRDHADRQSYGANILGGREAVVRMLDLFAGNGIRATWATVGFVFCEGREELLSILPSPEERPTYSDPRLSNCAYLDELGADEASDPYYFAPSLVRRIAQAPGQEVGTHTLSHCYCLEGGFTPAAFETDLRIARDLAARRGIEIRSIVFPRNQYAPEYLEICRRLGITAFRGNQPSWAYRSAAAAGQTPARRALRLLDAHTGLLGPHGARRGEAAGMTDIPASRFLRPNAGRLSALHPLHLRTIRREMTAAARSGAIYHLWWHPHNFGRDLEANMAGLRTLIAHFQVLAGQHGMASQSMADLAPTATGTS